MSGNGPRRGKKRPEAGPPRVKKEPPKGELRKPYPVWLVTVAAFVLPGSGQVLNGNAIRGIVMQFFMLLMGFITWEVTTPDISLIGRISGGIAIYVISVIDAHNVAKRRAASWERMVAAGEVAKAAAKRRPSKSAKSSRPAMATRSSEPPAAPPERPAVDHPAKEAAEPPAGPNRRP
jgi:hypothetical protein